MNEDYVYDFQDFEDYLLGYKESQEKIIELLEEEKELLQDENQQLVNQNAILLEQNNGLSLVVNYQYATIGVIVVFCVVLAAWKVLSKWFFGGV